ncbi:MAG: dehydrogenase, protein subunit alpha/beta [Pedosphaera sp.]|nr:dehydrogenase, protein subunit alpha/beta [Pedosphaera sp.]
MIRLFEEQLLDLFSQGKLSGTVHTCIGQELGAVAVAENLQPSDWIFSNHRCHGHYLAHSNDATGLLAEIMGKPSGICAGRGGSQHICKGNFFSNGVQGGGIPIAAGCALALKERGDTQAIAVVFIGDGTLGQGVLYETLNLASKWEVPLLFVLEINGYAQSTPTLSTRSGAIADRFKAFGMPYHEASIWQENELFATTHVAVQSVRTERRPVILGIESYRLKAHSKGDDNRDPAEVAAYWERDPITVFEKQCPDLSRQMRSQYEQRLVQIVSELAAEKSALSLPILLQSAKKDSPPSGLSWQAVAIAPAQRIAERLRTGLRNLLQRDERVMIIGEDLEDSYGGAFKVTKGLSTDFPGRVRNTPISEAAIVGFGNGMALAGRRPIVEIMFGDFITLAADQIINQASKFSYMYNEQVRVPVIIRTPMGGKRGYGATHSQSLEKHFFGTPGLHIVAVNSIFDPAVLLEKVHDHIDGPCLFIENKSLYAAKLRQTAANGLRWRENGETFPTLRLGTCEASDVTVVTYGGMVEEVEEAAHRAFMDDEIICEIIVPTMLFPLAVAPIVDSVRKTRRLLVVEEGQGFAGFGAEIATACVEELPGLPVRVMRSFAKPHPIPCSRDLEKQALPTTDDIFRAIQTLTKP